MLNPSSVNSRRARLTEDSLLEINKRGKELISALSHVPAGWEEVWEEFQPTIEGIALSVCDQDYLPKGYDITLAWKTLAPEEVKVVIIGQDPYYQTIEIDGKQVPKATGLAFSQRRGDKKVDGSLNNIYKELLRDPKVDFERPNHGDLLPWTREGVMLLNTSLLVRPGKAKSIPASHWKILITKTIRTITNANNKCIFLLWGAHAQSWENLIPKSCHILKCNHPSPNSEAMKNRSKKQSFSDSGHFSKVNEILIEEGKQPINWSLNTLDHLYQQ